MTTHTRTSRLPRSAQALAEPVCRLPPAPRCMGAAPETGAARRVAGSLCTRLGTPFRRVAVGGWFGRVFRGGLAQLGCGHRAISPSGTWRHLRRGRQPERRSPTRRPRRGFVRQPGNPSILGGCAARCRCGLVVGCSKPGAYLVSSGMVTTRRLGHLAADQPTYYTNSIVLGS